MIIEIDGKKWSPIKDYGEWILFQGQYYKTGYRKTEVFGLKKVDNRRKR